jgi:hypothetical protein
VAELSPAQRDLAETPGSLFVEACPGAGKTRAIVARYLAAVGEGQRRGVALLSFTNAAIDEARRRCTSHHALTAPNFLGTFDTFINRFISGPAFATVHGAAARFVPAWGDVPAANFKVYGLPNYLDFNLEWFDFDGNGEAHLIPSRVRSRYAPALLSAYAENAAPVDTKAAQIHARLVNQRRILSSSASRSFAVSLLGDDKHRVMLGGLLSARFREVIVDEAQDCCPEELEVLRLLAANDVDVVAVADLDQAIFEFRDAEPTAVKAFLEQLPAGTPLAGNFRSTPAICGINSRLRTGAGVDEPCGDLADDPTEIQWIDFQDLGDIADAIATIAEAHHDPIDSVMVLAHRRSDAARAAGATTSNQTSTHKVVRLAQQHAVLAADDDASRRLRAVQAAERVLVELVASDSAAELSTAACAAQLGIDERWLRDAAMRTALCADPALGRTEYTVRVRQTVQQLAWPSGAQLPPLGQGLATPSANIWNAVQDEAPASLAWSTIHAAKGREFDVVVLVIPKQLSKDDEGRTCLDLWEQNLDGESRRVLYVGASRARRLLVIAVHSDHAARVRALAGD